MTRTVIKFCRWTIAPDTEPDAEPTVYSLQCAVCYQHSGGLDTPEEAQDWALRHSGRNASHHTYRELIIRPWKAWMRD